MSVPGLATLSETDVARTAAPTGPSPRARRAILGACLVGLLLLLITQGVPYGRFGDPVRYAQMLNTHVQQRESQHLSPLTTFAKYDREPLFWFLSGDVLATAVGRPFTPFTLTILSAIFVFVAFRLMLDTLSDALVAFTVFVSTIQGFLVAFNLYRSALALLVFAGATWAFRRRAHGRPAGALALVVASLVAAMVHSVFVILAVAFIRIPRRGRTVVLYAMAIAALCAGVLVLTGLVPQFGYFWQRFQREGEHWTPPLASPILIGLVLLAFLVRRRRIADPEGYLRPLGILLVFLACTVVLRFSLPYERVYIMMTFLFIVFAIKSSFASQRETAAFVVLNLANLVLNLYHGGRLELPGLL